MAEEEPAAEEESHSLADRIFAIEAEAAQEEARRAAEQAEKAAAKEAAKAAEKAKAEAARQAEQAKAEQAKAKAESEAEQAKAKAESGAAQAKAAAAAQQAKARAEARKAAAKKAAETRARKTTAAKTTAAKTTAKTATKTTAKATAGAAAASAVGAKKAAPKRATAPAVRPRPAAAAPPPPPAPVAEVKAPRAAEPVVVSSAGRWPWWARLVGALAVLLIAAAAGAGTAAVVESGPETWRSTAVIQISPDNAASTYASKLPGLTSTAEDAGGVRSADVRGDGLAGAVHGDRLEIRAEAATSAEAQQLAAAGERAILSLLVTDASTGVSGTEVQPASTADRTKPDDHLAAGAGGLVAGGVLLLALCLFGIRRLAR